MKRKLAKTLFVIAFPLFTFGIVCQVIWQELRWAMSSIWLELRIEFNSIRDIWNDL